MKKWARILRFIIPIILLGFIISKIDFVKLVDVFENSNKILLSLAFISFPVQYLIFTIRWKLVLNMFGKNNISFFRLLKTIYIGFFAGFFLPAAVGIDIYRVVGLRNTDSTHVNIGLIFQEKLMGLVICSFFVLFFSGFLEIEMANIYPYVRDILYVTVLTALTILGMLLFFKRSKIVIGLLGLIEIRLIKLIKWFTLKFKKDVKIEEGYFNKVLEVSLFPKMILVVVIFGILNQVIGAVFSNIAFKAMGAEFSLLFNFFANPLMNIIFLLPISFGGFGIREGSYILIFGILGIDTETSLLVSFVFMVSTFINVGIGGIVFILDKKKHISDG